MKVPKPALFTDAHVRELRGGNAETPSWLRESLTYYQERSPGSPWRTRSSQKRLQCLFFSFFFFFLSAQSWSLSPLRSVSRCGRRQVVFSSEYVDGKGGAERRQVGWSVTASHWCALSYVGINHDSEMTYFLTPQTNSTFNRSQGLCQTTFSPCSLSKSCI